MQYICTVLAQADWELSLQLALQVAQLPYFIQLVFSSIQNK